jgi:hypothetical protein
MVFINKQLSEMPTDIDLKMKKGPKNGTIEMLTEG